MRVRYLLAGALLTNAIPHMIMGLAGKRYMTPLGSVDSTPAQNLAWAGMNLGAGMIALAPHQWPDLDQRGADQRLRAVTWGTIGMAGFAAAYELNSAAALHRAERSPTSHQR